MTALIFKLRASLESYGHQWAHANEVIILGIFGGIQASHKLAWVAYVRSPENGRV